MTNEIGFHLVAGLPVCFSKGEFSNYSIMGFFVPLESMSEGELTAVFSEVRQANFDSNGGWESEWENPERFVAELIRRGKLMQVTAPECWLRGDFGVEPRPIPPNKLGLAARGEMG